MKPAIRTLGIGVLAAIAAGAVAAQQRPKAPGNGAAGHSGFAKPLHLPVTAQSFPMPGAPRKAVANTSVRNLLFTPKDQKVVTVYHPLLVQPPPRPEAVRRGLPPAATPRSIAGRRSGSASSP